MARAYILHLCVSYKQLVVNDEAWVQTHLMLYRVARLCYSVRYSIALNIAIPCDIRIFLDRMDTMCRMES